MEDLILVHIYIINLFIEKTINEKFFVFWMIQNWITQFMDMMKLL